ncbi:hypothetical protein KVR01_003164 [Diaporthe batatas]|uniref:uncharacterized protein n=1 Tax=Diaporthe batatas TaxID=748121 RepID=UPI001D04CE42|nr:uncharacterized protein KVR01_003164 [Diaporthe batatas]KAG8167475.1 hypothetical protein KVR01_003164 [Diaporthe batatas]
MGEELYITASADDVNSVYKDTKNLDFDAVIVDLLREFGVSKDTLDKLFDAQLSGGRSWMDRQHDIYRAQMHPGGRGDALADAVLKQVNKMVQRDPIITPIALKAQGNKSRTASLWKWCGHVLVEASIQAFFGPSFVCLSPCFVADYLRFDEDYWRLKEKSPEAAATTKHNCVSALLRWLDLPDLERRGACWMVAKMEQDFADMGICDKAQLAALLFINIEVINGNAYKSCFWLLAHIIHTPSLLKDINAEVDDAFLDKDKTSSSPNMTHLLEHCPLLNSTYDEVLRYTNNAMGVRLVVNETRIGAKTLRPGRKLLIPYRQMHLDRSVWGSGAESFEPDRFLRDRSLSRSPSFRPFGGGNGYCPGRFLARREVFMFVATVLRCFQLDLVPASDGREPKFPELDETTPTGGILSPMAGDDVLIRVQSRAI